MEGECTDRRGWHDIHWLSCFYVHVACPRVRLDTIQEIPEQPESSKHGWQQRKTWKRWSSLRKPHPMPHPDRQTTIADFAKRAVHSSSSPSPRCPSSRDGGEKRDDKTLHCSITRQRLRVDEVPQPLQDWGKFRCLENTGAYGSCTDQQSVRFSRQTQDGYCFSVRAL